MKLPCIEPLSLWNLFCSAMQLPKAGWIFCSCFQSCGLLSSSWLIPVCRLKEAEVGVGLWLCRECARLLLFELMWESWLATWPFQSCNTPHTLKQMQFTAECTQKLWHKTGRFLLFCRLVAVETYNKRQPSSSGIIVQPLFSKSDTCLNKGD